jgi:hypothetical protein
VTRIWLTFALPLNLAFIVLLTGVFTLFYDPAYFDRIRTFLTPDCTRPCFMGVHPGIATADDARLSLEANPWVEKVNMNISSLGFGTLHWSWSGQQPDFINRNHNGISQINGQIIDSLLIRTHIRFGDIWLAFGAPERGSADSLYHIADYPHYGFSIRTYTDCEGFWETPVDIFIASWHANYDYSVHRVYDFATIRQIACKDNTR